MYIEYKPGEKYASNNAATSETLDGFQDAGLLLADNEVVIDIDHTPKDIIKAIIKEFYIKTQTVWTDRGVHFYFLKPSNFGKRKDGICHLGFEIEQHTKSSRPKGVTIKRNGVERVMENEGIKQYMPSIFGVLPRSAAGTKLIGLEEGENRNKELFKFRKILCKQGVRSWEKILAFINNHMFAQPLPQKELESIMRDIAIDADEDSPNIVTNQVIAEHQVTLYMGMIWWFDGSKFVTDPTNKGIKSKIYQLCPDVKTTFIEEVIKQILIKAPEIGKDTPLPIRFQNGYLRDGKFIKTSIYDEFTPYYVPIDYKPDAPAVEIVDEYIDNLTSKEPEYKLLLGEAMGYGFITDPGKIKSIGKFFFFRGDGANGKGTLLEIMSHIYGHDNCTNLSIKQLTDDRYKFTLAGKLANLGDDIEPDAITTDQMKVIKNIATADNVSCRKLYSQSETVRFTSKLFFTTNTDIKSFEKGYAYRRRVMWLPMFNKPPKPDPDFINKMTTKEALEYWIRLLVEGYMRLYSNKRMTVSAKVDKYNSQYHDDNDVSRQFAKEIGEEEIHGRTISELRTLFIEWSDDDRKFSPKNFKSAVWDLYKMGTAVGKSGTKTKRMFLKEEETDQPLSH